MVFFTGKGDDGTTTTLSDSLVSATGRRISKNSAITEALGSLDEINSFLGLCKVQAVHLGYKLGEVSLAEIIHNIQKNLFIIQAELAGAPKTITEDKVKELEEIVGSIEKELPPIKSFFISGGSSDITKWQLGGAGLGAIFDIARAIARRAERRVIAVFDEVSQPTLLNSDSKADSVKVSAGNVSKQTKAYLNRLSSALYALARFSNHKVGIIEESPDYR